jgi:hypothetical protein
VPIATWRRPALAPIYALVTAFVLVMAIDLATTALASTATLRIQSDDPAARGELKGSVIEIRDPTGLPVAVGELSPQGTYELPDKAQGRMVCLRLPARWHVTQPVLTNQCTATPQTPDFPVTVVKDGWVTVKIPGLQPDQAAAKFAQTKVNLRNSSNSIVESGPPDSSGHYQPRVSLSGLTVCATPPRTQSAVNGTEQCLAGPVTDPQKDTEITLEGQ